MSEYEPTEEEMTSPGKVSKINSAGLINLRIHNIWNDAHDHARKGKYSDWNEDLDRIWTELGGDVEQDGKEDNEFKKLTKAYSDAVAPLLTLTKGGFAKIPVEVRKSFGRQKVALLNKEIFLRRLQNKQGKGTGYYNEDDDDFG